MRKKLNSRLDFSNFYDQGLQKYGVLQPSWFRFYRGYRNGGDFARNLRAPLQIPIVAAGMIMGRAINLLENVLLFGIAFLTLDFSHAKGHGIEIMNSITEALYTTIKATLQMLASVLELFTRSVATLHEGIATVTSPCLGR